MEHNDGELKAEPWPGLDGQKWRGRYCICKARLGSVRIGWNWKGSRGSHGMALHSMGSTGWVSVGLHGLAMEGR